MSQTIDQVLAGGIGERGIPGVSAVVVDRSGVRYQGAFGERALGSGTAMTVDTVGQIASMTKALTGVAAMQLVERGLVDLDAPAGSVCPELAEVQVLDGFDEGDQPILRPPTAPITLRNLLTHTSGFGYDVWNADLARYMKVTDTPPVLTRTKAALALPLLFDPGTRWLYGIGIDWVGLMVEQLTGSRLGEYFGEHVTGPLGMADTSFDLRPDMLDRLATVHSRGADGTIAPPSSTGGATQAQSAQPAREFDGGGGGLYSTMHDYARFVRMILNDGELDGTRLLAPSTVADMAANHIGDLRVEKLATTIPKLSNDAELFPGEPKTWGLTFQINERPANTGRAAGTLMWAGLMNGYFWIDRAKGIGGCYLAQVLPFADEPALDLFYDFERAVYAEFAS